MANLRTTVVVKTDLAGFTKHAAHLPARDLSDLLSLHKSLTTDIAARNEGSVVKGEGDSFWLVFPSVTVAALAAVELQQEFMAAQAGRSDSEQLHVRVAITAGDVLHQEGDVFGGPVNLAARIQEVTPPDEVYLSHAAWLAMNKAEIGTDFVRSFDFKGIDEAERVYRIDQSHKTRVIRGQVIVFTDVGGFSAFHASRSVQEVEDLLSTSEATVRQCCEQYGGTVRGVQGDSHFLTFPSPDSALAAVELLCRCWSDYTARVGASCPMRVGIHRGDLRIFRSFIYGTAANITARLERLCREVAPGTDRNVALVSQRVWEEARGTPWEQKLNPAPPELSFRLPASHVRDGCSEVNVYELRTAS